MFQKDTTTLIFLYSKKLDLQLHALQIYKIQIVFLVLSLSLDLVQGSDSLTAISFRSTRWCRSNGQRVGLPAQAAQAQARPKDRSSIPGPGQDTLVFVSTAVSQITGHMGISIRPSLQPDMGLLDRFHISVCCHTHSTQ